MWEINGSLITGAMLGLEFPAIDEIDEDIKFMAVLDLLVFRFIFIKWKAS